MDTLTKNVSNDHYASNLVFDFDSLIDLDLGMIKYFKLNFSNSRFVDQEIINNDDIKFFQALLLERLNKNPLSIIIKPEYEDQINNLYNEIYTKNAMKIIMLSPGLVFSRIIAHTQTLGFMINTIICKNEYEEQFCKKIYSKAKTIQRSSKDFSLNNYDAIYLKNISDLSLLENMAKEVYLLSYAFNMEKGIQGLPKLESYGKMLSSLRLHLTLPYSDYIKPI